jgi:hypothetical protein
MARRAERVSQQGKLLRGYPLLLADEVAMLRGRAHCLAVDPKMLDGRVGTDARQESVPAGRRHFQIEEIV